MPINACGHRVRRLLRDLNKRCGGNAVHLRVYRCEAGSPILSEAQVGVVHTGDQRIVQFDEMREYAYNIDGFMHIECLEEVLSPK